MAALAGKTAVVTGGSRGIGYGIAKLFAQQGAQCVVLSQNEQRLTQAVETLPRFPSSSPGAPMQHYGLAVDVGDQDHVAGVCANIRKQSPRVDILVNAADGDDETGMNIDSLLLHSNPSDARRIIHTNLLGTMAMCQGLLKPMLKQKQGCIINFSSVVGLHGNLGQSVYAAAKAGVIGFTKSLAKEVGSKNVRVNCIAPGFIATDMTKGKDA
ncbi:hypothetical protein H4R35_003673 [Dimargaris xerosporica]|nr:hypothetical protein H4R35_003673 [Dimargaris xerosporica]